MSAAAPALRDGPLAGGEGRGVRPGLARLTLVELRKMVDTRAGFWLQVAVGALTVLAVIILCLVGNAGDRALQNILAVALAPASVLLPVIGVLLVSSEWSQRTAMITFTLVPERSRVMAAKLAASVALSLAAFAFCLLVAIAATAIAGGGTQGTWSLSAGMIGQGAFALATAMVVGVGFGAVLLSSAPAIVVYFVLPIVWSALGSISALEGPARWLDMSRSLDPLTDHLLSPTEWAHAGTTLALWMVIPVLAGMWRIARAEIRGG